MVSIWHATFQRFMSLHKRRSRTSEPTTPALVLSSSAASPPTAATTTSTSRPEPTSLRSTVPGLSASTGPSARTSVSAAQSTCKPTSAPGLAMASTLARTTTRSSRRKATAAVEALTSTFRLLRWGFVGCEFGRLFNGALDQLLLLCRNGWAVSRNGCGCCS